MRRLLVICALSLVGLTAEAAHPPKDCLPAAIAVHESLPPSIWKQVITVTDVFGEKHAYCVFRFKGVVYAYDRMWGSRRITPANLDPLTVAKAINFGAKSAYFKPER